MTNPSEDRRAGAILAALGVIPVVWAAMLAAPFLSQGLAGIIAGFTGNMTTPLQIVWCADTPKTMAIFLLCYGLGIGVYLSTRRNYRNGEEHGSAKWGSAAQIVKRYAHRDRRQNILLTQNTRIGLDGRKHRRNLNVMVVGGSGAGKTRFYAKEDRMKGFSPLQVVAFSILSVIAVVLAVMCFATARSISLASATSAAKIIYIGLAETLPSPESALPFDEPKPSPDTTPAASEEAAGYPAIVQTASSISVPKGAAFVLTLGSANMEITRGVTEDILKSSPGWLDTSAVPGQEGVCVIYGHRNRKHLKALEKVDYGDTIMVTMPDGIQYRYTVESVEIVASDAELRIPTLDGRYMMLVTCYPFHYSGHAPKKFVVMARG